MRAAARFLCRRLGRRGVPLLLLGVGKVCWGAGFIVQPTTGVGLGLLTRWAPLHCWAWVWILAGIITGTGAFLRIGRDWLGFAAAIVPPLLWALAYAVAAATGEYTRGLWICIWYLTSHVGVIMWASSVPEHSIPHRRRVEGVGE
jgi:hypothetical protein